MDISNVNFRINIGIIRIQSITDAVISPYRNQGSGLPIEVYFFLSDKVWNEYERMQSDIFDHLIAMAPEFGLKLYQLNGS